MTKILHVKRALTYMLVLGNCIYMHSGRSLPVHILIYVLCVK